MFGRLWDWLTGRQDEGDQDEGPPPSDFLFADISYPPAALVSVSLNGGEVRYPTAANVPEGWVEAWQIDPADGEVIRVLGWPVKIRFYGDVSIRARRSVSLGEISNPGASCNDCGPADGEGDEDGADGEK